MLSLLLDIVQHVVAWLFWTVAMGAWLLQRKASRNYKGLWQGSLKLTEQHYDEAQQARSERDEAMNLNQSLVGVLDQAEARWAEQMAREEGEAWKLKEALAMEREAHLRTDDALRRASEMVTAHLQHQREEQRRKQAEGAARLMAQREASDMRMRSATATYMEVSDDSPSD